MTNPSSEVLRGLYNDPIPNRPPHRSYIQTFLFLSIFTLSALCINATQIILLLLLPFNKRWRGIGMDYTKASFATLAILMCQLFAPTKFIVTTEGLDHSIFAKEPQTGKIIGIDLPDKLVIVANHQIYLDWWYVWILTYFLGIQSRVTIILKKSLKWAPIGGWAMQLWDFIFLERSWSTDRVPLGKHLARLGEQTQQEGEPLALMFYPEGTLVSKETKPLSKKYADKMGIADVTNGLLPRSTGLLFSLRSLAPYVPNLQLLDVTIGYPGIPPAGYGQSYYTIRSVFLDGVPPPAVHIHLRLYHVHDIPIGAIGTPAAVRAGKGADSTDAEKKAFDEWLVRRWREKDALLEGFYANGRFQSEQKRPAESSAGTDDGKMTHDNQAVEIPMELRSNWEIPDAFCYFAPALAFYFGKKIYLNVFK